MPPGPHITPGAILVHPDLSAARRLSAFLHPSRGLAPPVSSHSGLLPAAPRRQGAPPPAYGRGPLPRPPCGPCGKQLRGLSTRRRLGEVAGPSPLQGRASPAAISLSPRRPIQALTQCGQMGRQGPAFRREEKRELTELLPRAVDAARGMLSGAPPGTAVKSQDPASGVLLRPPTEPVHCWSDTYLVLSSWPRCGARSPALFGGRGDLGPSARGCVCVWAPPPFGRDAGAALCGTRLEHRAEDAVLAVKRESTCCGLSLACPYLSPSCSG